MHKIAATAYNNKMGITAQSGWAMADVAMPLEALGPYPTQATNPPPKAKPKITANMTVISK
jgi:hypothetical protein